MLRASGRRETSVFVLPLIRYGARPVPRHRPVVDRLLGVSRRRRQAGYMAIASGLGLLKPMLRRAGLLLAIAVLAPVVAAYLRLVF